LHSVEIALRDHYGYNIEHVLSGSIFLICRVTAHGWLVNVGK
jgi:hypothetical protein